MVPEKVMQIILSVITWQVQDYQGIRPSQNEFKTGRSCLTNLTSFNNRMMCSIDEGKAVNVLYIDFVKHLTLFPTSFRWRSWQAVALTGIFFAG